MDRVVFLNSFFKFYSLLIIILFPQCIISNEKKNSKINPIEGYILLENKVFEDVDSEGFPTKELLESESKFLRVSRKMMIKGNFLIDIELNEHFIEEKYIKTDTIAFVFYDLNKQRFMKFEKLDPDARLINSGEMVSSGSFSSDTSFDPMNGIDDSSWKANNVRINGEQRVLIQFIPSGIIDSAFSSRAKFWIDPYTINFPLQMSYSLSKKNNNGFVYKMQSPISEGKPVMTTLFEYQPGKLSDSINKIFKRWGKRLNNNK